MMSYLRGVRQNIEKQEHGGQLPKKGRAQNDPSIRTAEKLAKEYHVSPATIKRDAKFALAVDKLPPERRIGEFSRELPTQDGNTRFGSRASHDGEQNKLYILKDAGINHHECYETIANISEENS